MRGQKIYFLTQILQQRPRANTIFSISFAVLIKMEDEKSILSSTNKQVKASGERDIWEGSLFIFLEFKGFSFLQILSCSIKR